MIWISLSLARAGTIEVPGDYGTLSAAIAAASDGDTIEVDTDLTETVDLQGKSLTIVGNGHEIAPSSGSYVVRWDDGEEGSLEDFEITPPSGARAFVLENASVSISEVTINASGKDTLDGGAINIDGGSPSFEDLTITDAVGRKGGAIYIDGSATVTLTDVDIEDAEATWGAGLAITDSAAVTATRVTISDPEASRQGVGVFLDGATLTGTTLKITDPSGEDTFGAGLYLQDHAVLDLTGGSITGCSVSTTGYSGGGVYAENGSAMTLTSLSIDSCEASYGGAIALDASSAELSNVSFTGNLAEERGGAIYLESAAELSCDGCSFDANEADLGGAVAVDESSTFVDDEGSYENNVAANEGGAVWLRSAATFELSEFSSNSASDGGAIYAYDIGDVLEIIDGTFTTNDATGEGGAIFVEDDGELDVDGSTFDENIADSGGAIAFSPGDNSWDLTVTDSTFESNEATDDGGAIHVSKGELIALRGVDFLRGSAGEDGGALYVYASDELTVTRCLFFDNEATEYGGAAVESATVEASTWTNNLVVENDADNAAGILFDDCEDTSYVANNDFLANDIGSAGAGVIWIEDGGVEFLNNIVADNNGGYAIYCADTDVDGLSDFFHNDFSDNDGGGSDFDGCTDPGTDDGNLEDDPDWRSAPSWDGDESDDDYHLDPGSTLVDAGQTDIYDPDGSVSDIGAFGGPDAEVNDADGDGYYDTTDCDDGDATIHPDATETPYDGIDQDCDGVDLVDVDGDGYDGDVDDCDDDNAVINPGAEETWYDGIDADCDGLSDYDADLDLYDDQRYGGLDCDDEDAAVNPSGTEVWYDGVDQDCDGWSDYDADMDGFDSASYGGDDCDDTRPFVNPGAREIPYDGVDEDCDGEEIWDVDGDGWEGTPGAGADCNDNDPAIHPGAEEIPYNSFDENCDGHVSYDNDDDGFDRDPPGSDCDDDDASVFPGAVEAWYDGIDQDCLGDDDYDADGDGQQPEAYGGLDCDDLDSLVYVGASENYYDGIDQNCDGADDYDRDRDGHRAEDWGEDCDDRRDDAYPGAEELFNGLDDDCDGYPEDADRDGDGAIDWVEWAIGSDPEDPDTDDDGDEDGKELYEATEGVDSDLDGVLDVFDDDDDGDGIPSLTENTADPDRDGVVDADVDGDGIRNSRDRDSDGDGYLDEDEGAEDKDFDGVPEYIDYNGDYAGGGCAGFGITWLSVLAFPVLLSRRRRHFATLLGLIGISGLFAMTSTAEAADSHGYQLLGTTGDVYGYARIAYPDGGQRGDWDVSVVGDHAWRPLVEVLPEGRTPLISNLSTANIAMSGSLGARTRLEAVVPVHAYGVGPTGSFAAMGDARLGAVVPAWSPAGIRPGLAIAPSVWIPTGSEDRMVGNPGISAGGVVTVAQELGRLGWVANVGARAGRFEPERNLRAGAGPLVGVGAHYAVTDALTVATEATVQGSTGFSSWPVELMASGRIRLRGGSWATVGVGAGLNDAVGASTARVVIGGGFNKRNEPPPEVMLQYVETIVEIEVEPEFDPLGDDDGDGVLNGDDRCPDVPIYEAQDPRFSDGCPKLAELSGDRIIITQSIFFREASATIQRKSFDVLDEVARILIEHPEIDALLIEGHTNDNGGPEYNYRLSEDRAVSVMRHLIDEGVDRNRLVAQGYGYDVPLVEHDHADAKQVNRRVEFTVVKRSEEPGDARIPDEGELAD